MPLSVAGTDPQCQAAREFHQEQLPLHGCVYLLATEASSRWLARWNRAEQGEPEEVAQRMLQLAEGLRSSSESAEVLVRHGGAQTSVHQVRPLLETGRSSCPPPPGLPQVGTGLQSAARSSSGMEIETVSHRVKSAVLGRNRLGAFA